MSDYSNQTIDWGKFTDSKSAIDLLKNSVAQSVKYDYYAGKTNFKVVALSPSIPLAAKDAQAFPAGSAGDNRMSVAKYIIFGRIIEDNSPHSWIPNPCLPTKERGQQETLNLIMAHTVFIVYGDPKAKMMVPVKPGDIFMGQMTPNSNSFNLQYGRFLEVTERGGQTQQRMRFAKDCDSLAKMFPTFPDFADGLGINPKGATYNGIAGTGIPIQNGRMPSHLLGQVDTTYSTPATMLVDLVPAWNKLSKAYYEWTALPENGGKAKKIQCNGGYRTFENALRICGGIEPAGSPRAGRCKNKLSSLPGTSRHGWGAAIDWQLTINWGNKSKEARRKQFECPHWKWMWANAHLHAYDHPHFGQVYWTSPAWARPVEIQSPDWPGEGRLLEAWHWEPNIFDQLITGISKKTS